MPFDGAARRSGTLPVHVVEGVDEAEVGKLQVLSRALLVGVLDVEVGDVVGEDGQLVGVYFVAGTCTPAGLPAGS